MSSLEITHVNSQHHRSKKIMMYIQNPQTSHLKTVVFFNPLPHEINRTQWYYKQISNKFAKFGVKSIRFDYPGTGNSCGDFQDFSLDDWINESTSIVTRLIDEHSHRVPIFLIGTRIGGSIISLLPHKQGENITNIFVDPIEDGNQFILDMKSLQEKFGYGQEFQAPFFPKNPVKQVFGYPWTETFTESLKSIKAETCRFHEGHVLLSKSRVSEFSDLI